MKRKKEKSIERKRKFDKRKKERKKSYASIISADYKKIKLS